MTLNRAVLSQDAGLIANACKPESMAIVAGRRVRGCLCWCRAGIHVFVVARHVAGTRAKIDLPVDRTTGTVSVRVMHTFT